MNVLVIGSGGREHAIVWKLQQSPQVETVYVAPGNVGMRDVVRIEISDYTELAQFALANNIGLSVVGPEVPLCAGIVDVFRNFGLNIFGPDAAGAKLEDSKAFAKEFMARHQIPTAASQTFTDQPAALAYIRTQTAPIVVKADGLAAGKGVTVAETIAEACAAVEQCFEGAFGRAGERVVIEECLIGEEASIIALVDHNSIVPLASSQDHKRAGEGDTGLNTGGMGAYSPAPVVTPALWEQINAEVLQRFLHGCQQEIMDFRGVIYAGIMVTASGPKVLEFNVRFGDPETQVILPRLQSDLVEVMLATINNQLDQITLQWSDDAAVCVVAASGGYPEAYAKGHVISGCDAAEATGVIVFHAGTDCNAAGQLVNSGGRVLGITALGADIKQAVTRAYAGVARISWQDMFYRRDIAHRALHRS